jgi:cyclopropane fatty-acyl-phospholipid synthase-like methyltransferase
MMQLTTSQPPGRPQEVARSDGWQVYWETLDDHQRLYREQAHEYVRNLTAALPLNPQMRVLDFGCGFGLVAATLAPLVGELFLWDASPNMWRHAQANVAGYANVRFLDRAERSPPVGGPCFDLILVNSVIQYMTPEEFSGWLACWRDLLGPGGRIVMSDIIPPDGGSVAEILDLLKFSARRGFLVRALWQAAGELGRYRKIRHARPLTRLGHEELRRRGREAGLVVTFLPRNLTHFPRRVTAVFARRPEQRGEQGDLP